MSDAIILTLAVVVPFGLVALVAYKMATKKKRPELKLVEDTAVADEAVKEVVAKAKKINKNKARRGKKNAKKN
jgi:hypothetical protein